MTNHRVSDFDLQRLIEINGVELNTAFARDVQAALLELQERRAAAEPKAELGGCNIACRRCGKETTLRYTDSSKTRVSTDSITGWTYDTENGARCPSCQSNPDFPLMHLGLLTGGRYK